MHLNVADLWHHMVKHPSQEQEPAKPAAEVEKLWTENFIYIALLNLLIFVGGNMLITTFPFYVKALGGTELTVGVIAGLYSVAALLMRPVTGWFLDHKSRKLIFVVGLAGALLFPVFYVVFPVLSVVMVLRVLHGFLWSAAGTSCNTNACDLAPQSRFAEGMGYFGLTNSMALAIAPALGLAIMESAGFTPTFLTSSAFCLLALLLLARVKLQDRPQHQKKSGSLPLRARLSSLFSKDALPASLLLFFAMLPAGSISSFIALYAEGEGLGNGGVYFTFQALFTALFRVFGGKVADKQGEKVAVYGGSLCFFSSLIVLVSAHTTLMFYASAALFGVGYGLTLPSYQAMSLRTVAWERRGAASSTYLCFFDLSWGLGGALGGVFASAWGYRIMFALMGVSLVVGVLAYYFWGRKTASAFDVWKEEGSLAPPPSAAAAAACKS